MEEDNPKEDKPKNSSWGPSGKPMQGWKTPTGDQTMQKNGKISGIKNFGAADVKPKSEGTKWRQSREKKKEKKEEEEKNQKKYPFSTASRHSSPRSFFNILWLYFLSAL